MFCKHFNFSIIKIRTKIFQENQNSLQMAPLKKKINVGKIQPHVQD